MRVRPKWLLLSVVSALCFSTGAALAAGSKLSGTSGVMQIEGAAGGGLVPWSLIAGLGSKEEIGASAFTSRVDVQDFELTSTGLALGLRDRLEFSFARQAFDLGTTVPGESIRMDVIGAKMRLGGDAIFESNPFMPQIALGVQHKKNRDFDFVPKALGAKQEDGVDVYLAATKVFLSGIAGRTTLVNATLRATEANQLGLLGFGGDLGGYSLKPELSAVVFVTDTFVVGAEYRFKPNRLSAFEENDFADAFIAWFPHKSVAIVAGFIELGNIADKRGQSGLYASIQLAL